MKATTDVPLIVKAVADLRSRLGIPVVPEQRGPVPLGRFLDELNLIHVSLPVLTRAAVSEHLQLPPDGFPDIGNADEVLAGYLFRAGDDGHIFIGECEPTKNPEEGTVLQYTTLPRHRFTAAHELGHFVLHKQAMRFFADTKESVTDSGSDELAQMEQQANLFATLLLMPEEVVRARATEFQQAYGCCPRSAFGYHLASELLVSSEAMRNRLTKLGVGDA